jgi:predicted TIM-barrel fold metal-dependent hydrolase
MTSRRDLLGASLGAGASLAVQSFGKAAAMIGNRQIVDAQVHLWWPQSDTWKWVPGAEPQMPEPFMVDRLVPLMDEAGVDRAVIVTPSWTGDRNDAGLDAAKRYPSRLRVMGRIALKDPKSADLVPTWKLQPGMLGIRILFLGKLAPWLTDGTADWFWPAAEMAGIPVMVLGTRIAELGRVAEKHPGLTLIIDHMGLATETVKAGKSADMVAETASLAKYPNVSVKLSGMVGYSSDEYPWRDMTTYVRRCYDAFGPRRCFWGSDLTNSFGKATYRQRIAHITETLDFLSEEDKDWIMGRGILACLGWS